jgi:hypothetical protein
MAASRGSHRRCRETPHDAARLASLPGRRGDGGGPRITRIRGRWRAIRRARRLARSERALALAVLDLPERLGPPIVARFDERDAFFDPPR